MRMLAVLVALGVIAVVASSALVYAVYPPEAGAAARAAGGRAPFEAGLAVASGSREAVVRGLAVAYTIADGHCVVIVESRGKKIPVALPHRASWSFRGERVDACRAAALMVGERVVVRGLLVPGPRGPVVVACAIDTPQGSLSRLPGATWVPPCRTANTWSPHRGHRG